VGKDGLGPRFSDDVWDFRPFVARTITQARIDFATLVDDVARRTVNEYLYSRIHRGTFVGQGTSKTKSMKITYAYTEFNQVRVVLETFRRLGAERLAQVTRQHLTMALAQWKSVSVSGAAHYVAVVKHLAAHGAYISEDRLTVTPWLGRASKAVAGLHRDRENTTARIPEYIIGPLVKAAVFYVETASRDILAARCEVEQLEAARAGSGSAAAPPRPA
jgi:hypothetical protein